MEPTTKKWKNRKTKKVKTDTLRGNGKQSGESVESVMKKKECYGGKDLQS